MSQQFDELLKEHEALRQDYEQLKFEYEEDKKLKSRYFQEKNEETSKRLRYQYAFETVMEYISNKK